MSQLPSLALIDSGINVVNASIEASVVEQVRITTSCRLNISCKKENDLYGHGTRMAGILTSIAPKIQIIDIGTLDANNKCTPNMLAASIYFAIECRVKIIALPLSLVGSNPLPILCAAAQAISKGITLVSSYQNIPSLFPSFPAEMPGVFGVKRSDAISPSEWACDVCDVVRVLAYSGFIESVSRSGRSTMVRGNSSACSIISAVCYNTLLQDPSISTCSILDYLIANSTRSVKSAPHPSEYEHI